MVIASVRGGETVGQLALKFKVSDKVMQDKLKKLGFL